ncbi:AraC family transcriptional regulator [Verrucomicrobiaceae bacterium N1E253]|uniref:AraC family transcriptional regulator n=1 Tax=Oceaniferula marina TaxID=2748318 RepID=A0A851GM19_9BACT|nr:AraC family transcriptional regulator [Oceaniferula marina]NWK56205.1 AraC family transcriptional regulator [Oceaniferula marina]
MDFISQEEAGGGYRWRNIPYDPLFSGASFHVLCGYRMQLGREWKNQSVRTHYARLYYVEEGEAVLEFDDEVLRLRPGYLYLIPSNVFHRHRCEESITLMWCHFRAEMHDGIGLFEMLRVPRELKVESRQEVESNFRELLAAMEVHSGWGELKRTQQLLGLLMPFLAADSDSLLRHDRASYLPVFRYLDSHLHEGLGLDVLAEQMGLSPEHFCRVFKRDFQVTPMRYVMRRRVHLAQQLLCQTNLKHYDISDRCGFSDTYHFSKVFKQMVGVTPSAYRGQHVS